MIKKLLKFRKRKKQKPIMVSHEIVQLEKHCIVFNRIKDDTETVKNIKF